MAVEVFYEDDIDGEGDIVAVEGDFELQLTSPGGGRWLFYKALGEDGSANDTFDIVEEFTGPAHRYITNPNISQFKVILSGTKTVNVKRALYQVSE